MIESKTLVYIAQTILWILFMIIDANLLLPSIIVRYVTRVKSQASSDIGRGRQRQRRQQAVVIVGGNFSGLAALRELQNNPLFRVILIDQRDYLEFTPGILRLFCQPNHLYKLAHPLPHGSHKIIKGTVTKTWKSHVTYVDATTRKATTITFDYLIMATGSTYNYPITASKTEDTIPERFRGWQEWARRVKDASSILILGGGAVGTELAAEIVDHYNHDQNNNANHKSVTLVDAAHKLVPLFAPQVSEYAEKWLKSQGVKLILGQALDTWDNNSCTFKNGKKLQADLVFVCFGDNPNSNLLLVHNTTTGTHTSPEKKIITKHVNNNDNNTQLALPPPAKLDRRKCVKVDAFLRVEGRRNVFCCGNVAAPPTEDLKQAFFAEVQGHVAGENVVRLATGRPFIRYPEDATMGSQFMPLVYVLSLGRWDGVIGFNNLVIPGPLAAVMKWIIEWTKIRQMLGRPIGILVWKIGDAVVFLLSKKFLRPRPKNV